MTFEEFDFLCSREGRRAVRENLAADPLAVAMRCRGPFAAAVATQVKYLQRAGGRGGERGGPGPGAKLPSYVRAGCIIPPLAFEQSSAEAVAAARRYSGRLCIDLTCGLGVDAFCLSRRFGRVIAVERDPLLAAVARHNFALLGADNIEVIEASAEHALRGFNIADLIFVDPDRRGAAGQKLYKLEDCSPDVVTLMPRLRSLAATVAVKCSPLFDVDRARALFGEGTLCEAVSWGDECKEVLIEVGATPAVSRIRATAVGRGSVEYDAARPRFVAPPLPVFLSDALAGTSSAAGISIAPALALYLTIPDVTLQKARVAAEYFSALGAFIESDNGFALHNVILDTKLGRSMKILSIERFSPKKISKSLRDRGIRGIDILVRDFPLTAAAIARQLGVREGGAATFAFTRLDGQPVCIEVTFAD